MANFPNLGVKPIIGTVHSVKDNSLKSQMTNGCVVTRKAYSRQLHSYQIHYPLLGSTSLDLLLSFYETCNGGSASFNWADDTGNQRTVRFDSDLSYKLVTGNQWAVSFNLAEV